MTKLCKFAHQNKLNKLLTNFSLIITTIIFLICFMLLFEHYGFDRGSLAEREKYKELLPKIDISSLHDSTVYEIFANLYRNLTYLVGLLLIEKFLEIKFIFLKRNILFQIALFSLIGGIFYNFWRVFYTKQMLSENLAFADNYGLLLRESTSYDWICIISAILLLILQLFSLLLKNSVNQDK